MYTLAVLGFAVSVSLAACKGEGSSVDGQPWIGQMAPRFSLERFVSETESGPTVSLNDFRGRFVVIHFATSW